MIEFNQIDICEVWPQIDKPLPEPRPWFPPEVEVTRWPCGAILPTLHFPYPSHRLWVSGILYLTFQLTWAGDVHQAEEDAEDKKRSELHGASSCLLGSGQRLKLYLQLKQKGPIPLRWEKYLASHYLEEEAPWARSVGPEEVGVYLEASPLGLEGFLEATGQVP